MIRHAPLVMSLAFLVACSQDGVQSASPRISTATTQEASRTGFLQACEMRMRKIGQANLPGMQMEKELPLLRANCDCAFRKASSTERATLTAFFNQTEKAPDGTRADNQKESLQLAAKGLELLSGLRCDADVARSSQVSDLAEAAASAPSETLPLMSVEDQAMFDGLRTVCTTDDTGSAEDQPERCGLAKELLRIGNRQEINGAELFERMMELQEQCRAGEPAEQSTREACGGRDGLADMLRKQGACQDSDPVWAPQIRASGICG